MHLITMTPKSLVQRTRYSIKLTNSQQLFCTWDRNAGILHVYALQEPVEHPLEADRLRPRALLHETDESLRPYQSVIPVPGFHSSQYLGYIFHEMYALNSHYVFLSRLVAYQGQREQTDEIAAFETHGIIWRQIAL